MKKTNISLKPFFKLKFKKWKTIRKKFRRVANCSVQCFLAYYNIAIAMPKGTPAIRHSFLFFFSFVGYVQWIHIVAVASCCCSCQLTVIIREQQQSSSSNSNSKAKDPRHDNKKWISNLKRIKTVKNWWELLTTLTYLLYISAWLCCRQSNPC